MLICGMIKVWLDVVRIVQDQGKHSLILQESYSLYMKFMALTVYRQY